MNRLHILFIAAIIVVTGSLVGAFATIQQRDFELRGYVNPLATVNLPYRVPLLGVNAELTQYSASELPVVLAQMEAAGVHWVRQFAYWDQIEQRLEDFSWEAWDIITDALAETDLEVVVVLMNTPEWARSPQHGDDPTAPPDEPHTFAAFASEFASRYGDVVDYYQIWDEPNLWTAWGGLEPKPAQYLALLSESYQAIHNADTTATVISAALAPTTEDNLRNISDLTYLDALYTLGLSEVSDAVAAKPYGFDAPPDDRTIRPDTLNFSRIVVLREVMNRHSDDQTALWASNWGWNSLPDSWQGQPSIWGSVSQEEQTTYTLNAFNRAIREWAWLGGMILYHWQPDAPPDDPVWGFALVDQHNQPTPLLQSLIELQANERTPAGHYPPRTPLATYSGLWTFSEFGADIGWQRDTRLSFTFTAPDVGFILRKGDYVGYLYPQVDNQPANAVPQDSSGNSYIILTSASLQPEVHVIPVSQGLSESEHTLTAVADRGYDQYALMGYAVGYGDLAAPYNTKIALAGLIALFAGVIALSSATRIAWYRVFSPLQGLITALSFTWQMIISVITSIALLLGVFFTFGDLLPALFRRESVHLLAAIATAGLLYLNPSFILTLVAAVILFVLIYNRLLIGLILTLFYAPFFLFPVELYTFAFPMAEILILLTFVAFMLRLLAEWGRLRQIGAHQYPFQYPKLAMIDFAMIGWVILGAISLTWAERTGIAITELRVLIIEPALFYLILRAIKPTRHDMLKLADALLISGALVAIIGLIMYAGGQSVITAEMGARRLASVYGSPNNVALFLGRCVPFALAFFLRFDGLRRWFALITGIVMLIAVLLTQSVGGIFIGIPAGIGTVLIFTYGRRAILPLIGIGLIAIIGFSVLATQSDRFARALDFTQGTNLYRLRVWESALDMITDQPLTGVGLDQFLYEFRSTYIRPDAEPDPNLSHPHNFILDFWTRLGFFGVVVFLALQFGFWRTVQRMWRDLQSQPVSYALVLGAGGGMINLLAHGLIDNSVYVIDLAFVFIFLLAIAVNISEKVKL